MTQNELLREFSQSQASDPMPTARLDSNLKVSFFGVSTLLFQTETSAVLIDGFFSRPEYSLIGKIEPNPVVIGKALSNAGIATCEDQSVGNGLHNKIKLDAIYVVHSHFDHALDIAVVSALTGAPVYGSKSTKSILDGYQAHREGVSECGKNQIVKTDFTDLDEHKVEKFDGISIYTYNSKHISTLASPFFNGAIKGPLTTPASTLRYKEGGVYGLKLIVEGKTILIHASASCPSKSDHPGTADVVFLGVGALGFKNSKYIRGYWECMVESTGVKSAYAIHWDDFIGPVFQGQLKSNKYFRVEQVFDYLLKLDNGEGRLKIPPVATPFSLAY